MFIPVPTHVEMPEKNMMYGFRQSPYEVVIPTYVQMPENSHGVKDLALFRIRPIAHKFSCM